MARELHGLPSVQLVVIGQVFRRRSQNSDNFNCKVAKIHKYQNVVLDQLPFCYYWRHRGFWNSTSELYLPDGVHLDRLGNYKFMRSIREAIFSGCVLNLALLLLVCGASRSIRYTT